MENHKIIETSFFKTDKNETRVLCINNQNQKVIKNVKYNKPFFFESDKGSYRLFNDVRTFIRLNDKQLAFMNKGAINPCGLSNHMCYNIENYKKLGESIIPTIFFDIETESLRPEDGGVRSIVYYSNITKKYKGLGLKNYEKNNKDLSYKKMDNEDELLYEFFKILSKYIIVIGYYSNFFDIPFLIKRVYKNKKLTKKVNDYFYIHGFESPIVEAPIKSFNTGKIKTTSSNVFGFVFFDYQELIKKYYYGDPLSQNRLDYIGEHFLGIKKLDLKGGFDKVYKEDFNFFIDYNKRDVEILVKLEEKLKYLELAIFMKDISGCNLSGIFHNSIILDSLISKDLFYNKILPPHKKKRENINFKGGYLESRVGRFKNVVGVDFTSLYPFLIFNAPFTPFNIKKTVNIGNFENHILDFDLYKNLIKKDEAISADGNIFKKEGNLITKRLLELVETRIDYKKKAKTKTYSVQERYFFNNYSIKLKELINSYFGVFGSYRFRYYNKFTASSITTTAQKMVRCLIYYINESFNKKYNTVEKNYIVYSATDSVNIVMPKGLGIDDFPDDIIKTSIKRINDNFKNKMGFLSIKDFYVEKDAQYTNLINLNKRYRIYIKPNDEKIYFKGLKIISSNVNPFIKSILVNISKIFIYRPFKEFINNVKNLQKEINDWVGNEKKIHLYSVINVSKIKKYKHKMVVDEKTGLNKIEFANKTMSQLRGSIIYNYFIKKLFTKKFLKSYKIEKISNDTKVALFSLKYPAIEETAECVISVPLDLDSIIFNKIVNAIQIDEKKTFDRLIYSPLKSMINFEDRNLFKYKPPKKLSEKKIEEMRYNKSLLSLFK